MHVAFCHPLSHLKRRAIKADPGHLRTDNTCRVENRRKFPPWNGRRGTLKTLGRGLKEKEKGQIKWRRWLRGWQFWTSNNREGNWLPFKTATLEWVREKAHTELVAINKFHLWLTTKTMPRPRRAQNTGEKEKTIRRQGNTFRMMSEPRERN